MEDRPNIEPFVAYVMNLDEEAPEYSLPESDLGNVIAAPDDTSLDQVLEQKIAEDSQHKSSDSSKKRPPGDAGSNQPAERATNNTVAKKAMPEDQLEPFEELNARESKVPWADRYELIKKQFPSVENLDWSKVFRSDPTIMGSILNDIIKVEVAPPGRPGKRPALEKKQAREILSQYQGEDYTLLPFAKALNRLKNTLSVRQLARKISMSPSYCYNLMSGYKDPSIEDMTLVAGAFDKHPSYFYEYRVAFVSAVMAERINYAPESSIIYYERTAEAYRNA